MSKLIHTGQALVDVVVGVPELPAQGQNVMASSYERAAGGAVNILAAAARQGADCVHAGAIGTGPNGDLVRAALAAEGVTWSSEAVVDADTGPCFVLVEPTGERTFVTTLGAERALSEDGLHRSRPEPGDLVCVTGYSLAVPSTRDPLMTWLSVLPDGVLVVLDPGAVFAGLDAGLRSWMLSLTDVWTGNQEESSALTGVSGMAETAAAVGRLLGRNKVAVVRDGASGCAVWVDGQVTVVPGYPQTPVDTNGAGDAHTGILVAGVARGLGWVAAAKRANAGAAIKVTRRGPATAPGASEIDGFLGARPAVGWTRV